MTADRRTHPPATTRWSGPCPGDALRGLVALPAPTQERGRHRWEHDHPVFRNPSNKHHAVSLTAEQFRYAFAGAVSEGESQELHEAWTIPSPGKPLFEAASANFAPGSSATVATRNPDRGPLLLVMGGQDKTVPEAITKAEYKKYRDSGAITDLHEFPDRSHSLTVDHGWTEVARDTLTWWSSRASRAEPGRDRRELRRPEGPRSLLSSLRVQGRRFVAALNR